MQIALSSLYSSFKNAQNKHWIADQISFPQSPRFLYETEKPFKTDFTEPPRTSFFFPGQRIEESSAHPDDFCIQFVKVLFGPFFLFGNSHAQ